MHDALNYCSVAPQLSTGDTKEMTVGESTQFEAYIR